MTQVIAKANQAIKRTAMVIIITSSFRAACSGGWALLSCRDRAGFNAGGETVMLVASNAMLIGSCEAVNAV